MRIRVRTYGDLRKAIGDQITVVLNDGSTVKLLASKLRSMANYGAKDLFREERLCGSKVTILLNGQNLQTLQQLDTELSDGDIVTFLPLVVGGSTTSCQKHRLWQTFNLGPESSARRFVADLPSVPRPRDPMNIFRLSL